MKDLTRAALRAAGVRFSAMPDRAVPDARGCGIPHGVVVTRGPTGIVYDAPLVIDCSLARQLPAVEAAIQDAATAHLGARITRVGTFGTFSCRPIRGWSGNLSEHAFGNAIDLALLPAPRPRRRGGAALPARRRGARHAARALLAGGREPAAVAGGRRPRYRPAAQRRPP